MQQVCLAAARRAVDGKEGTGPGRPAVKPGDRRGISVGDEEILAPQGWPGGKVEGKLGGAGGSHSGQGKGSESADVRVTTCGPWNSRLCR